MRCGRVCDPISAQGSVQQFEVGGRRQAADHRRVDEAPGSRRPSACRRAGRTLRSGGSTCGFADEEGGKRTEEEASRRSTTTWTLGADLPILGYWKQVDWLAQTGGNTFHEDDWTNLEPEYAEKMETALSEARDFVRTAGLQPAE